MSLEEFASTLSSREDARAVNKFRVRSSTMITVGLEQSGTMRPLMVFVSYLRWVSVL